MKKLAQYNRLQLRDLLGERLAIERCGVRLYDAALAKVRATPTGKSSPKVVAKLQEFRDDEKAHEEWLEEIIRDLGGDADEQTPRARLAQLEALGIERVLHAADGVEIVDILHALLMAELADTAGWDLLVQLAVEAGDKRARKQFQKRLSTEMRHLAWLRKRVLKLTAKDVMDPVEEPQPIDEASLPG